MAKMDDKKLAAIGRWGVLLPPTLIIGIQGIAKFVAAEYWRDEFIRWGLPAVLVPVIGGVEVLGAVLAFVPQTRPYGAALLAGVMAGAAITHIMAGEWGPMVFTIILGGLAALTAWWARPTWLDAMLAKD